MSHEEQLVSDCVVSSGTVAVEEYETAALRDRFPRWDEIPAFYQLRLLRRTEPSQTHETDNTTCIEMHERIVDGLDKSQPAAPKMQFIALGRGSTTPAESDRSLTTHVADVGIIGYDDNGANIFFTAIVASDEANVDTAGGEALREVAAIAGGVEGQTRYFCNHSLFAQPIEKNETVTATVTVQLIFDAA